MTVTHHADARRFIVELPEGLAYLAYEPLAGDTLDLQHTIVPDDAQGRGVGSALVEAAFAHARDRGLRVVPTCPFVEDWLGDHPEQRDIVASGE
jgi:predicted GNAT family acetyltransferase